MRTGSWQAAVRRIFAAGLAAALLAAASSPALAATAIRSPYPDVRPGHPYAPAIAMLTANGVLSGDAGFRAAFRPEEPVTRAEFTAMVIRLLGRDGAAKSLGSRQPVFADADRIPAWSWGYVTLATSLGIVEGYPDGRFRPDGAVSGSEAAAMLIRAVGREGEIESSLGWPYSYLAEAGRNGLLTGLEELDPNRPLTRGQVAQMSANAAVRVPRGQGSLDGFSSNEAPKPLFQAAGKAARATILSAGAEGVEIGEEVRPLASSYYLSGALRLEDAAGRNSLVTFDGEGKITYVGVEPPLPLSFAAYREPLADSWQVRLNGVTLSPGAGPSGAYPAGGPALLIRRTDTVTPVVEGGWTVAFAAERIHYAGQEVTSVDRPLLGPVQAIRLRLADGSSVTVRVDGSTRWYRRTANGVTAAGPSAVQPGSRVDVYLRPDSQGRFPGTAGYGGAGRVAYRVDVLEAGA